MYYPSFIDNITLLYMILRACTTKVKLEYLKIRLMYVFEIRYQV